MAAMTLIKVSRNIYDISGESHKCLHACVLSVLTLCPV